MPSYCSTNFPINCSINKTERIIFPREDAGQVLEGALSDMAMAEKDEGWISGIILLIMAIIFVPNFLYFLWKNRALSIFELINEVGGNAISGASQTLMVGWEYPAFGCCILLPLILLIPLGWKKLDEDNHSEEE